MKLLYRAMFLALTFLIFETYAEPTTESTKINSLRLYMFEDVSMAGHVLITVASSNLCNTNSFKIDLSLGGGTEAYSMALAAFISGKEVQLEILNSKGCTGDWTSLQSVIINN